MGEPGGQGADPVLSGSSTGEGGGEGVDPCSKYRRASLVSSQTRAGQEGRESLMLFWNCLPCPSFPYFLPRDPVPSSALASGGLVILSIA